MQGKEFGELPSGKRLERILKSLITKTENSKT